MTLLQIANTDFMGYLFGFIVALVVAFFICRWIFRIDTIVHYLKIQAELLIKIAKYSNVPHEEIYQALGRKMPKELESKEINQ